MSASKSQQGGAAVKITGDRSPLQQALNDAKQDLQKFGRDITRIGLSMGAVGGAALLPMKQAVTDFSAAEQALGRFRSIFGDAMLGPAEQFAQMMSQKVNTSIWDVRNTLSEFMALYKGAGFDDAQAFALTKVAAQGVEDLKAFDDAIANTEEARNKLRSGVMGEQQPVIAYGADVRVANTNKELKDLGYTIKGVASLQEQIIGRMSVMTRAFGRSGITGQAEREVLMLASRLRGLRASVWDLSIAVGKQLAPIVNPLVGMLTHVVRAVQQWVEKNGALIRVVAVVAAAFVGIGSALIAVGTAITVVTAFFTAMGTALVSIGGVAGSLLRSIRLLGTVIVRVAVPAIRLLARSFLSVGGVMRAVAVQMLGVWHVVGAGLGVLGAAIWKFGDTAGSAMRLFAAQIASGDFRGAIETLRTLIASQFAVIATSIRYYLAVAREYLAGFGVAVRYAFATAANYVSYYWSQIVNVLEASGVLDVFRSIWKTAQAAAQAFWTWIVDAAAATFDFIKMVAANPVLFLGLLWEELSAWIGGVFRDLAAKLSAVFATIWSVLSETAAAIGNLLTVVFVTAVATAIAAWENLVSFIMSAVDLISSVFQSLWDVIGAGVIYVASQFTSLGAAILNTLQLIGEGLWALLGETFEDVVQGLRDAWYGLTTFLIDTFSPVINWFGDTWTWLSDQFTRSIDLMSDAWDSFWSQSLTESLLDFQELAGQTFLYLMSLWDDSFDLDGAMQELNREFNARRKDAQQASQETEERKNANQALINQQAAGAMEKARLEAASRREAAAAERDAAARRMAGLKGEFDARRAKLAEEEAARQKAADQIGPGVAPKLIDPNAAEGGIEVSTGFVNSALQKAMGVGDTVSQSIAGSTAATAKNTERINKSIENIQQRAGQ